ncbi:MAG: UbiX family flavin prenyltransferase [Planctomycetota bacterium]|nr:MAG: UbiX family flavin prenyltransferase [Planctomycetota bacterium]
MPREGPGVTTSRIVVGISGASGALYARGLVRALVGLGREVHLTASAPGLRLLHDELGMEGLDAGALAGLPEGADPRDHGVFVHPWRDIGASIASGSFLHDGMAVIPCSGNTLGAIAAGLGENLLTRAAQVCLKERRPLVLVHRESPLTLIDIENMRRVTEAGAIVAPANPGLYFLPTTVEEIVDFVVAKTLDLLRIEHDLAPRWGEGTVRIRSRRGSPER